MKTRARETGFTLIELMLAMVFITFLLLFTVSVITQITMMYSKGISIRQINQSGRQVVDSLGRSLRDTTPRVLAAEKRLCVNGVTYAWNTVGEAVVNNFEGATPIPTGFVSIIDPSEVYCQSPGPDIPRADAVDVFGSNLTVIDFSVEEKGALWDITLFLSTSGDNVVQPIGGVYGCEPDNKFCAFGEFTTSVYKRRS